jgi:predicted nucleic acid-binding protein
MTRYSQAEKMEIIRLVETSQLPVKQTLASEFLTYINSGLLPIVHITEEYHQAALEVFAEQNNKGTSVFDCSNVVVVQHLGVPAIVAFDDFYHKKCGLRNVIYSQ